MNADRDDASELTMDGKGRVTIPMALRKSAGIAAGTPLNIQVRDGRIVIEPAFARHRIVLEHGLPVAELTEPAQPLTAAQVRRSVRALRERRMK